MNAYAFRDSYEIVQFDLAARSVVRQINLVTTIADYTGDGVNPFHDYDRHAVAMYDGGVAVLAEGPSGFFIAKLSAAGVVEWASPALPDFSGVYDMEGRSLQAAPDGRVFVPAAQGIIEVSADGSTVEATSVTAAPCVILV